MTDSTLSLPVEKSTGRPDRKEEVKTERRRRNGMGLDRNRRLHYAEDKKDPAYEYRWANDTPGRIAGLTEQDDYDIVMEDGEGGEGTPVKRAVGTGPSGEWKHAYLVRKPKKYYEADKKEEQDSIADAEQDMKEKPAPSADGLSRNDHAYVPQDRVNVIE